MASLSSLLDRMTLEEKIGQLTMVSAGYAVTGPFVAADSDAALRAGRIGSMLNLWGSEATRETQRVAVEETRLGIPLFFGLDVIHGFRTVFPVPLAEACAFDPDLWERTAAAAAAESAAAGLHLTFAPMLDVGRDPRWGRIVEGPGEDPLVASRFATAKVRGFQGGDAAGSGRVAATAKHYAAYGAVAAGRDYASVDISERTLREVYLPPFRAAVAEGVLAVMPAFTDLGAIPLTANVRMLRAILRQRWGFRGVIISDYDAIAELVRHGVAGNVAEAAALALKAGVDIDLMSYAYERGLPAALQAGLVEMPEIDAAVFRVLALKERLGLFEDPYRRVGVPEPDRPALRALAREAGARSLVLLKNDGGLLPIPPGLKRIALIGPLADAPSQMLGPWGATGRADEAVSVLAGLRAALPDTEILHAAGVTISGDETGGDETGSIATAVALARDADRVVVCLGEAALMSGEAASRATLSLPGRQMDLFAAVVATGRPVIVLLFSGRPVCAPDLFGGAEAVLACGFPGSEAGHAVADILLGKAEPAGRLSVTWPRHPGQVPIHFAARPSGRPENPGDKYTSKYLDLPNAPQFPFGHGLHYSAVHLSDYAVHAGDQITVHVAVSTDTDAIVWTTIFLFIRDPVARVSRPLLELKDFVTLRLAGRDKRDVTFTLSRNDLTYLDESLEPRFDGGAFEILVGPSADRARLLAATIDVR